MEQTNRMPLEGIRVIDLTIWVKDPQQDWCSRIWKLK